MEQALCEKRVPRSSSLYRQLGERIGVHSRGDAVFDRLCGILRRWFSARDQGGSA